MSCSSGGRTALGTFGMDVISCTAERTAIVRGAVSAEWPLCLLRLGLAVPATRSGGAPSDRIQLADDRSETSADFSEAVNGAALELRSVNELGSYPRPRPPPWPPPYFSRCRAAVLDAPALRLARARQSPRAQGAPPPTILALGQSRLDGAQAATHCSQGRVESAMSPFNSASAFSASFLVARGESVCV